MSSDQRKPPRDSTRSHSQKSLETDDWQSSTPIASAIANPAASDNGNGEATPVKRRFTQRWAWGRRDRSDEESRGWIGLQLLHASAQPLVDMIFVHGLRGGSIKTWRKGSEHHNFWPQFWLPLEPGFENVNIYTFGYDSDWADFEPCILDVHAFGQNLLEQMRNCPYLRDNRVGHPFLVLHTYINSYPTLPGASHLRCADAIDSSAPSSWLAIPWVVLLSRRYAVFSPASYSPPHTASLV